jgi:hypothetical protein
MAGLPQQKSMRDRREPTVSSTKGARRAIMTWSELTNIIVKNIVSGAIGGTAGALVALGVRRWWEVRLLFAREASALVAAVWTGTFEQAVSQNPPGPAQPRVVVTELTLSLRPRWPMVVGTISYRGDADLRCSGGFFQDRILMLHYWTEEPTVLQHGVMVLRLVAAGTKLVGHFVGYGPATEGLVTGNVDLTKKP